MGADWWAKKLGIAPAPVKSTPDTWNVPRHQPPTPAYERPPQQQYIPPADNDPIPTDENGQIHFMDAAIRWKGGDATKKEHGICPNCGSRNYFSRSQGQGRRIGLINRSGQKCQPAPICFECGYNGLFESFGGGLTEEATGG